MVLGFHLGVDCVGGSLVALRVGRRGQVVIFVKHGKFIDLPEARLTPQTVMSLQLSKPVVAAYCVGAADPEWWAARLRWSLDQSVKPKLRAVLLRDVRVEAARKGWIDSPGIKCSACGAPYDFDRYLQRLVDLALEEFHDPAHWDLSKRLIWFSCSESTWHSRHRARYEYVCEKLERWLGGAALIIWRNQPWEEAV